ncbi:hypothetical protein F0562_030026 [Nyssa sinensis]|uniref:DUF2921 domain-containing protein n=1 Tax=Nyssa sinensis TaxID=561372 RepID=A0A5J5AVU6_9ASTE|nr:hypothetical protein F0562_030026 [Nyssa sinensis]
MKIHYLVLGLWTLLELFGLCYTASFDDFAFPDDSSVVYTYNRLKNELSFFNGDWEQGAGGAPLMPFDDSDMPMDSSSLISPLRLVNFEVKDVNSVHQSKNTVSLGGVLSIGISRNSTFISELYSNFHIRPGLSALKIVFEGIYIENEENGGENLPLLLQDDQIFLVLRYPQTFSLTKRAIQGKIRSLNGRESFQYFDEVHLSSQLGRYSRYKFSTEKLNSRTCDPYLLQDELMDDGVNMLNASEFCKILQRFSNEIYNIAPNWKFSGGYEYYGRLGPFLLRKEIKYVDWSYMNVKLMMQNVICEQETTENKTHNARVSAVLRAFPAVIQRNIAARRMVLSGTTLSVEGLWNSSAEQLCMVGCLGVVDSKLEGCDSQISIYFPCSLSSRQRSIILGSISSIRNEADAYFPILFGLEMHPSDLHYNYGWYSASYLSYKYSKTDLAGAFKERSWPSELITTFRRLFLTYPALENKEELFASLNLLSQRSLPGCLCIPVSCDMSIFQSLLFDLRFPH